MNILALDTSMSVCSAAVLRTGRTARACHLNEAEMTKGHAEALMPMIEDVLGKADLKISDIELVAATQGPGSFTGVRIAIAAARGFALVSAARLFGTDSLTVMARAALRTGLAPEGDYAVAADARRGMIYLGLYDRHGNKLEGPLLLEPSEAVQTLPRDLRLVVGSGGRELAEAAEARGRTLAAELPALQPGAVALAEIASQNRESVAVLRPLYLRPPDAKPQQPPLERR